MRKDTLSYPSFVFLVCNLTALDKERLSQQRQLLNKRLGLDLAGNLGIDTGNLFNDEDLQCSRSNNNGSNGNAKVRP